MLLLVLSILRELYEAYTLLSFFAFLVGALEDVAHAELQQAEAAKHQGEPAQPLVLEPEPEPEPELKPQPEPHFGVVDGGGGGGSAIDDEDDGEEFSKLLGLPAHSTPPVALRAGEGTSAAAAAPLSQPVGAAAVSPFVAWIGSPCLRHCVHGASIGGGREAGDGPGSVRRRRRRRCAVRGPCMFMRRGHAM
eukprot:COSAG01_NODE_9959_length_2292_cov_1.939352_1_plen_192_part_00